MFPKIIDTHLHVWDFKYSGYHWLGKNQSILNRNYFVAELEEERRLAGVSSAVLVQADNTFEDTDRMLEIAAENEWISGVVGWLPLTDPIAMELALKDKYLLNHYFKGVRHLINDERDEQWLLQETVVDSLAILVKQNLPYDLVGINTGHLKSALVLAARLPELRMVFDHLNQPPINTTQFGEWGELMTEAAKHKNLYCKISGLGTASGKLENWNEDDLKPCIEFVLEKFGEDRCFCGGDWPVSLLAGSYNKHWDAYKNILGDLLTAEQLEKVFYKNARRFYDLDV